MTRPIPIVSAAAVLLLLASCVPPGGPERAGVAQPPVVLPAPAPARAEAAADSSPITLDGVPRQGAVLRGRVPRGTTALFFNDDPVAIAPDGAFIIAFDRDAGPNALLRAQLPRRADQLLQLAVAPATWDIQHVNVSRTAGVPSAEFMRRRGPERERIAAARAAMTPGSSQGWRQSFIWPVRARISGRFGSQRVYRGEPGSYHSGLDLAAPPGTTYVAPADGVVILIADEPFTLEGRLIMIDHGMGLNSAFLHSDRALVKVGDMVRQGQPIGTVGATGRATGPHLHWGLTWNGARVDPLPLVIGGEPYCALPRDCRS